MQKKITQPPSPAIDKSPGVRTDESIRIESIGIAVRDKIKSELTQKTNLKEFLNSEEGKKRLAVILSDVYLKEKGRRRDDLDEDERNVFANELIFLFTEIKEWLLDVGIVDFRTLVPSAVLPNSRLILEMLSNPNNLLAFKHTTITPPGLEEKAISPQIDAYLHGLFKRVGGVLYEMKSDLVIFDRLNPFFSNNDRNKIELEFERDGKAKEQALKSLCLIFTKFLDDNSSLREEMMEAFPSHGKGTSEWTINYMGRVFEPVVLEMLSREYPHRDKAMLEFIRQADLTPEQRALVFFIHLFGILLPFDSAFLSQDFDERFSYLGPEIIKEIPDSILFKLDSGAKNKENVQKGMLELLKWYCGGTTFFYSGEVLFNIRMIRFFDIDDSEQSLSKEVKDFLSGRPEQFSSKKSLDEKKEYILKLLREFSKRYILLKKSEIKMYGPAALGEVVRQRPIDLQKRWSVRKIAAAAAATLATIIGANNLSSGKDKTLESSAQVMVIGVNERLKQVQDEATFMENIRKLKGQEILELDANSLLRVFSGSDNVKGNRLVYLLGANESGWVERGLEREQVIRVLKKLESGVKPEDKGTFYKIIKERFNLVINKNN